MDMKRSKVIQGFFQCMSCISFFILLSGMLGSDGNAKNLSGGLKGKLFVNSKPQGRAVVFLIPRVLSQRDPPPFG